MVLDTRSKRASSVGVLLPFVLAPVLPDGTIDQGDRQHIVCSYSGILAEASVVVSIAFAIVDRSGLRYLVTDRSAPRLAVVDRSDARYAVLDFSH